MSVVRLPRTYWVLWSAMLLSRVASFVVPFLVLYLTSERGLSVATSGAVATVLGIGALCSGGLGGWAADKIGRRPTILVGFTATALCLVALALASDLRAIWVAAFAVGLTSDLARPAMAALVADLVPAAARPSAYNLIFWAVNIGFAVATVTAGALSGWGFSTLFLIDAAVTALTGLFLAIALPRRLPTPQPRSANTDERGADEDAGSRGLIAHLLTDRPALALVGAMVAYAVVYQQAYVTLPVVMGRDGLGAAHYGSIIAVNGLVIVALQPFAVRATARWALHTVFASALLLVGLGFALTTLAGGVAGHIAALVVWTIGEVGATAVMGALFADRAPAELRGRYMGIMAMTFTAGMAIGPVAGTTVLQQAGEPALWGACLGLLIVAAGAVRRGFRHEVHDVRVSRSPQGVAIQ